MTRYILARSAGYCFGVERSVRIARETLEEGPCFSLGELIHNRDTVSELEKAGMSVLGGPDELPEGERIVIRAHGVGRAVYESLEERHARVIDATCPLVRRIHRIAQKASEAGRLVAVVGDRDHPEVRGICGWSDGAIVFEDAGEMERWLDSDGKNAAMPLSVVFQTTQVRKKLIEISNLIKKR